MAELPKAFNDMDRDLTRIEMLDSIEKMIATVEHRLSAVARLSEKLQNDSIHDRKVQNLNLSIADTSKCLGHLQQAKIFILAIEGLE